MNIKGYKFSASACGLKKNGDPDVGVMFSEMPLRVSAVFTKNKIKAAPVIVSKSHAGNIVRALIVNSGNANACNGEAGLNDAKDIVSAVAKHLDIGEENVLICSTGVIGERLNASLIINAIPEMVISASKSRITDFARSIMTTDTFSKISEKNILIDVCKKKYKIIGIAKGSGMIMPDMATMLGFIFTDLPIKKELADRMFKECIDASFNAISVDGDTSTNDTAMFFYPADAKSSDGYMLSNKDKNYNSVKSGLCEVCSELAKMLVKDGEGSTKVVKITVLNAYTEAGAKKIAFTLANSLLFKTMITGEDLNWGRIMAAVGRARIRIKPDFIDIFVQDKKVVENSRSSGKIDKDLENSILSPEEIDVKIDLKCGKEAFTVLTCNLTKDYVDINGSYRS